MRVPLDPIVRIQRQVLDQPVPLLGTPYALHYGSDRAPGRAAAKRLSIALTGPSVRSRTTEIMLEVHIAGQVVVRKSFAPRPNLVEEFQWDGLTADGSAVAPRQVALVRIGTTTRGQWPQPARTEWRESRVAVGAWDAMIEGFGGWTLDVHHALDRAGSTLWLGDGERRTNLDLDSMLALESGTGIPSTDGSQVFVFDVDDRHVATFDGVTGMPHRRFEYDGSHLVAVIGEGLTKIDRDQAGAPTAIVGPYGGRTSVDLATDGTLAGLTDPVGGRFQFSYAPGRLLSGFVGPHGGRYGYEYDPNGRLVRWTDPAGAATLLARTVDGAETCVTVTQPGGESTVYTETRLAGGGRRRTSTCGGAGAATETVGPDRARTIERADGATAQASVSIDPLLPGVERLASSARTTPSGRTVRVDAVTETDAPTSPLRAGGRRRERIASGGAEWQFAWDPEARTLSYTTPEGRESRLGLDDAGHVLTVDVAGRDPMRLVYDGRGRGTSWEQGSSHETWDYDDARRAITTTDANGGRTEVASDVAGRRVRVTTAGGGSVRIDYDPAGTPARVTMPGGGVHTFGASAVGLIERHQSPGGAATTARYDADRRLVEIVLPSGRRIGSRYGTGGRLEELIFPEGTVAYGYGAVPDRVNRIERTAPDGSTQRLSLEYDGELLIGQTWEGPAAGRVGYRLDDAGRPVGITIDGGRENLVGRDRDGRIILDGPVAFDRTGSAADIARVTVGGAEVRTQRDGRGRVVGRTVSAAGREIHAQAFEYDAADRLIARTERVAEGESRVEYRHDADGRLTRVAGVGRETTAEYDPNGNRTALGRDGAVVRARYDPDDRLVDLGGTAMQADADGFITDMRDGRTFEYSARGELLSATTPDGERIAYGYDGLGRRMSRTTAAGRTVYLYGDPARPRRVTAIRTPSGLERLWYDDEGALVAIERAGGQFVVASDQVGTPRAVFAVDGTMVAQFNRDPWGVTDGSPVAAAWPLEIGFAGGIQDSATGLVRFGQRDYDPATGRWMALDPAGLGAADWNLYAYCGNDPVTWIDRSGLRAQTPEEDAFWGPAKTTPLPDSFYRRSPTVPNGYSSQSGSSSGFAGRGRSYFMNHRYWQPGGGWSSGPGRGFSICPSVGNASHDPHDQTDVSPGLYGDPMSGHVGPQNSSNDPGMPSGYGPVIKIQF